MVLLQAGQVCCRREIDAARALEIQERSPESPRAQLARSLNGLGIVCGATGRDTEAEAYLRRALQIREELQGAGPAFAVALSLHSLSSLLIDRGNFDEAEPLLRRSLALYEKTLGPDDLETAGCLRVCARMARLRGRFEEADTLARRAIAVIEKRWGHNHPQVAHNLQELAENSLRAVKRKGMKSSRCCCERKRLLKRAREPSTQTLRATCAFLRSIT